MSDLMRPLPFADLVDWALAEHREQGRVFGIREQHFFRGGEGVTTSLGDRLAVPLGPAAGPHTQLAQNIVVSYLCGARFIELKTVQKMDGEEIREAVRKPCINAEDEAYNCEWSTELTVEEAFAEYVKAWFLIALLKKEHRLASDWDLAYNMSVGYDLEGIQLKKIDDFIEGLKDASRHPVFLACRAELRGRLADFRYFAAADLEAVPSRLCNAITLSTLHGTQPAEIKSIAQYLLTEKKLHTFVKLNPTLLGYDYARETLDRLGYDYIAFTDHHFKGDLQYDDALVMLQELRTLAEEEGLVFGIKLTNTFPVDVENQELPAQEMYLSGRALLPLTIALAARLAAAFDGALPISYSGGADAHSLARLLATGIAPVTVATTLLKPGGYERFLQLAQEAERAARDTQLIDVDAVARLAEELHAEPIVHKRWREKVRSRKTGSPLPAFDCFKAPCKEGGCPIEQQIPEYLKLVAEGREREAFELIAVDNTAPTITGILCSEPCRDHCTRLDYEEPLAMRDVKKMAADSAQEDYIASIQPPPLATSRRVAVIGAGSAGLAAGLYLRRGGMAVDLFERLDRSYGIVRYIIPAFRIADEDIERDARLAEAWGLNIEYNCDPDYDLDALLKEYDDVILATGAWKEGENPIAEGGEYAEDALQLLWRTKVEGDFALGRHVAVIGAGDVAMDSARLALRIPGVETVSIVYRRSETYMPASQEDVNRARQEGIRFYEMTSPVRYDGKTLTCEIMAFGDYDASGRKSVHGTGRFVDLAFDHVVIATGARVDTTHYVNNGLALDERGRLRLDQDGRTSRPHVYAIGDGRRGPATIVQAMADARNLARFLLKDAGLKPDFERTEVLEAADVTYARRGRLKDRLPGAEEGGRCLKCDAICEVCVEVCPNRANIRVELPGFANPAQIVHIDRLCNECGNCATFCPHAGKPYTDKPTVFARESDFLDSRNDGFLKQADGYRVRIEGQLQTVADPAQLAGPWGALLRALVQDGRPLFGEE